MNPAAAGQRCITGPPAPALLSPEVAGHSQMGISRRGSVRHLVARTGTGGVVLHLKPYPIMISGSTLDEDFQAEVERTLASTDFVTALESFSADPFVAAVARINTPFNPFRDLARLKEQARLNQQPRPPAPRQQRR